MPRFVTVLLLALYLMAASLHYRDFKRDRLERFTLLEWSRGDRVACILFSAIWPAIYPIRLANEAMPPDGPANW